MLSRETPLHVVEDEQLCLAHIWRNLYWMTLGFLQLDFLGFYSLRSSRGLQLVLVRHEKILFYGIWLLFSSCLHGISKQFTFFFSRFSISPLSWWD